MGVPLSDPSDPAPMQELVLDPAVLAAAVRELDTLHRSDRLAEVRVAVGALGTVPAAEAARAAVNQALHAAGLVSGWLDGAIRDRADALAQLNAAAQEADRVSASGALRMARPLATDARRSP